MASSIDFNADISGSGLKPIGELLVDPKGLEPWSFSQIVNKATRTMLIRMYEFNPEISDQIEEAYNRFTGGDFSVYKQYATIPRHTLPSAIFMHGPPGHGKSSVPMKVAQNICELLDLNLVTKFDQNYVPGPRDFVMPVIEMSNETSNLMVGGIPIVGSHEMDVIDKDGKEGTVKIQQMERALFQLFNVARMAPYGMIIMDDVSNLPRKLQNIILSLLEESRFQNTNFGKDKMFFATGNLGAADGSVSQRISAATSNRALNCYLESNAALETLPYLQQKHISEDLDVGVTAYLHFAQEMMKLNPYEASVKNSSHFCPRTIDKLCGKLPNFVYEYDIDGQASKEALLEFKSDLKTLISSIIGLNQAETLTNFIADYNCNHRSAAHDIVFGNESVQKRMLKETKEAQEALKGVDLVEFQIKRADAILSHYFERVVVQKDLAKMTQEERDDYHMYISKHFENITSHVKDFARNRVNNTLPALLNTVSGVPAPQEVVERITKSFHSVIDNAYEPAAQKEQEAKKKRGRRKANDADMVPNS